MNITSALIKATFLAFDDPSITLEKGIFFGLRWSGNPRRYQGFRIKML